MTLIKLSTLRVIAYRNGTRSTRTASWKLGHLPRRQTLIWAGPLFLLIQRSPKFDA